MSNFILLHICQVSDHIPSKSLYSDIYLSDIFFKSTGQTLLFSVKSEHSTVRILKYSLKSKEYSKVQNIINFGFNFYIYVDMFSCR